MGQLGPMVRLSRRIMGARSRALGEAEARGLAEGVRRQRPGSGRDSYRYVFVVTYGRSGSTLVQGLLNAMPRTLVRGENNLYLLHLFHALHAVRMFRREHWKHRPDRAISAFYGLDQIRRGPFVAATNDIVTTTVLGDLPPQEYDVLGFKEVLWHRIEPEETAEFFEWLEQCFPDVGYVLNTRDPQDCIGSGFWQEHTRDAALARIGRVVEIQEFLRQTRAERCFDIRFEELTGAAAPELDTLLGSLAAFVTGRPATRELVAQLRSVLNVGHGPYPFGETRGQKRKIRVDSEGPG
ncbi:MAG TPA: sulfotransferase [Nocardioides sp.]|jgi:hypothetical protein